MNHQQVVFSMLVDRLRLHRALGISESVVVLLAWPSKGSDLHCIIAIFFALKILIVGLFIAVYVHTPLAEN